VLVLDSGLLGRSGKTGGVLGWCWFGCALPFALLVYNQKLVLNSGVCSLVLGACVWYC